jgi:Putative methyltransferase
MPTTDVWNRTRDGETDWWQWHELYDVAGSPGHQRLLNVQRHIDAVLDARAGPVRVVSVCAGQGRDLLPLLARRAGRPVVRAWLVETDARNVAEARRAVEEAELGGVEVVVADAGTTDAYADAVPADLLMVCGVFGNISDKDVYSTVSALPSLCAEGATVIWTRHRSAPDLTPTIRRWFAEAGFEEQAFDSPGPGSGSFSVGVDRLVADPRPYEPARRLFAFTR